MAVLINQVITEVILGDEQPAAGGRASSVPPASDELVEQVVRAATERVLATLRREWDR